MAIRDVGGRSVWPHLVNSTGVLWIPTGALSRLGDGRCTGRALFLETTLCDRIDLTDLALLGRIDFGGFLFRLGFYQLGIVRDPKRDP